MNRSREKCGKWSKTFRGLYITWSNFLKCLAKHRFRSQRLFWCAWGIIFRNLGEVACFRGSSWMKIHDSQSFLRLARTLRNPLLTVRIGYLCNYGRSINHNASV